MRNRGAKSSIVLFGLAFLVWIDLSWPPDWQHIVVGVFVAALVSFLTGDMFIQRPHLLKHPQRYLWFLYYLPIFAWECLKANVDVAYRVGHPDIPIQPGIVKVKTALKSDTALTFLANSITLTPGTLSVDVNKEKAELYIHWINVLDKDVDKATELIAGRFEKIIKRIFDE